MKTLIIGGVAGGATAAARLRRLDEGMEIVILERGGYVSFANCGLPYYIGGEIQDKSRLTLQTPENFKIQFDIDVRIFNEAISIDRERKTVTVRNLQKGETYEKIYEKIYEESYDKLILSPGAAPLRLPIPGADSERVFTLRNIPDTYSIKNFIEQKKAKSAAILGGGAIGVEMAENFKRAGLDVTIIELTDQLIAPIDFDVACAVHKHVRGKGVRLLLGNGVKSIEDLGGTLKIILDEGEVFADMLLLSAGVRPESQLAKDCGLELGPRGFIVTDDHMRTTDPDIYAVGDVVEVTDFMTRNKSAVALAGPANKQGRIAADNICGGNSVYTGTQGSSILKAFDMTVASTGLNEKTAKRLGIKYEKSFTVSASHASYYPGAFNLTIKTLFDADTGKILGAQLTGIEGVDKRCDVIAAAIRFGATAYDLTKLELCYAPPYSSAKDPVNMAGFVIENLLTGKVKNFHWHDIAALDPQNATLIDVRTEAEFSMGAIPNFVNIPLGGLRGRLGEIDKSKPVYVMCQVGLRGYIACRILTQRGYDAHNLSGGYAVWSAIQGGRAKTAEIPVPSHGGNSAASPADPKTKSTGPSGQGTEKTIAINACGLQCPGPVMKLSDALNSAADGDVIDISTTDPASAGDVEAYCKRTGNTFLGTTEGERKGVSVSRVRKGSEERVCPNGVRGGNGKNFILFSGDLDKAVAAFIMANASAAMGRKTSMFFTFWGLNILRKSQKMNVSKDFMSSLFAKMMPRGSKKLGLSKMNFAGLGAKMIRFVMKSKNVDSLEMLMKQAMDNGVELVACSMSMDIMGIAKEELIDGVKMGGAAYMLAHAEESDMSLFI
ncbi:MAG: FAD-dependent oxidoreductase [Synergistaceae bacterium]|jgi:NADPH-dependent 2,4-dienoyl-CoA reductase/sulfur reductase-like enzyme/peroxiredoxin family protein/rhodanese-related sulfurtransferase/TusA-related sulfurtransferase|nr:FAD-dependent oxidoreductase [Synergistaceae bacterium]